MLVREALASLSQQTLVQMFFFKGSGGIGTVQQGMNGCLGRQLVLGDAEDRGAGGDGAVARARLLAPPPAIRRP
jgi:hypothetical protein